MLAILAVAVAIPDEEWKIWVGTAGAAAVNYLQIVLGIGFLALLLVAAVRTGTRLRPSSDPVPDSPASLFKCRVLDSDEDARLLTEELVARVFPDGSIDPEHSLKAHKKNPRRLVGLIDAKTGQIAGWSSIWPVTVDAGKAIECGKRLDDDLKVEDVLPARSNKKAKYLVLLSFAILPEYRNAAENPVRRFGRFVIDHIIDEFLGRPAGKRSWWRLLIRRAENAFARNFSSSRPTVATRITGPKVGSRYSSARSMPPAC